MVVLGRSERAAGVGSWLVSLSVCVGLRCLRFGKGLVRGLELEVQ